MASTSIRASCSRRLPAYRDLGITTLLRGHAGEFLHMRKAYAFSLDAEALAVTDESALEAWLWPHLSDYMVGADRRSTVSTAPAGATCSEHARTGLPARLAATTNVGPQVQRVWQLFVRERLRRETAAVSADVPVVH